MHETARDLRESGAMDAVTMRAFDALCLSPVKAYTAREIKQIRNRQSVFAAYLNVTKSTVS